MHRFSRSLLTCLVLICGTSGCSVNVSVNAMRETDLGSHHVVVRPGSTMTSTTEATFCENATYEFTCGDVQIKIENEALTVNVKSYGMLKPGESIEVDHGKVLVAGKVRQPVAVEKTNEAGQPPPTTPEAD
jgi:hypothetical protein